MTTGQEITKDSLQIARLEEQFSHLRETIDDMQEAQRLTMDEVSKTQKLIQTEIGMIKEELQLAKGGWRMLMMIGGAFAAFGGALHWCWEHIRIQ